MRQDNQREAILLSYLAGIVDGEGTIRINAQRLSKKPHWNIRYAPSISIGMTNKEIIELFVKVFGSKLREECVPNRKKMFRWGTSGTIRVLNIVKKLYPYLIVKKEQARLLIEFCENKQTNGFRRNEYLPDSELQRRKELYEKVKKLNAVGAPATTK
jgi:hypothetical protein